MAIFKCKMCGGNLEITEEMTVCECEYCGTKQTVPKADDEKKMTLFTRANRLRAACEFDKAAGVYESIVTEFPEEAEAYWGLVLCKYGIEYVDDPRTGKKIPTCHRSSFDGVFEDPDFNMVLEYSDAISRAVYREEAKAIEAIRTGIVEVSSKEEPYDIFICYKETDENGDRTIDSVLAQDVYNELTEKGYRVFFSRITLEDKLGQEYEPYIFAALNSAKVMLAFGTDYEYYNAVWVKNEWSRFLAMIEKGAKKTLIPCYKGIDAYDMPPEFKRLQAQDMGKVGAIQDLLRGIEKILGPKQTKIIEKETVVVQQSAPQTSGSDPLVKRGNIALQDGDWAKADEFFERALDIDPECAEAYLGKLLAELRLTSKEQLANEKQLFDTSKNYEKFKIFAKGALAKEIEGYLEAIRELIRADERKKQEEAARIDELVDQIATAIRTHLKALVSKSQIAECDGWVRECDEDIAYLEDLSDDVKSATTRIAELNRQITEINKQITEMNKQVATVEKKISTLNSEHASLGFFDLKRKREINIETEKLRAELAALEAKIAELSDEKVRIKGEIEDEEDKCDGYTTKSLNAELTESKKKREHLISKRKKLQEIAESKSGMEYKEALSKLADKGVRIAFENKYPLLNAKIGDTVWFGEYEQGRRERICWKVLDVIDNKVLLISKNIIEKRPYHSQSADVTWETCDLRKWLNNEFYKSTFSEEEKKSICLTTLANPNNPEYGTRGGNDTKDKVFLLSIDEVKKYFTSDEARTARLSGEGSSWWWLRSPGRKSTRTADVDYDGSVHVDGDIVSIDIGAVRPALWIDISNL